MATKFSDFTAQAATGTTFVVGYDGTTNTRYTQDQLTNFVLDGTLSDNRTLKLDGNNLNIDYGTGNVYPSVGGNKFIFYPNGSDSATAPIVASVRGKISFPYLGHQSQGLTWSSYNTKLTAYGFTLYGGGGFSHNSGYCVIGPSMSYNSGAALTARLGIIGKGNTNATYAFRVQNSDSEDIFSVRDDKYVTITGNNTIGNFFTLKNEATWTMLDAGDAGSNAGQLRIKSNNNNRFWFKANDGLAIGDAGAVTIDSSAVLKVDSTTKGMLPPRMTTTQRDAINSGTFTTGLTIYNTTTNKLQFYNGSAWQDAASGGDTIYTGNGSIDEDRTITVGYPTSNPKNTYVTTFESNKTVGGQNAQKNVSGTQIVIREKVNNIPSSYSQTRGAVLKLQHQNTSGSANAEGYVQAFISNSGSSDYMGRDQMGFRTNKAFVFQATNTSWPLYFGVRGGPSNNYHTLKYSGGSNGGLFQLSASNARVTKFTMSDAGTHYRYIQALNTGKFELGRKIGSSYSEEAFITMNGIGSWTGNIGVGINQGTPTATLHVTGSGATNATTALLVENSSGDDILNIKDDGAFALGKGATPSISQSVVIGDTATANQRGISIGYSTTSGDSGVTIGWDAGVNFATGRNINIGYTARASGLSSILLTAANGNGPVNNTENYNFSVYMTSQSTPDFRVIGNEGMIPPSITTTVRDAISSPASGSTIYNTTDNKLQFYNGSAWTDAGGGGDNIYTADGTIGASRVVTITDFPKFSGTQSNPIGLEIENTQGSSSQHTTHGAQLKLTSNGASSTISFYNGGGGGGSSPAMKIDSPDGIKHTAAGAYLGNYHAFSGGTWTIGMTNSPLYSNSPRLRMQLGGGGGNGSFYTTEIGGSSDYLYMFMSPGTAGRHIALGEYTDSTTTYKDFLRINSSGDIGINQDTPTGKLHVTGSGSTSSTTSLLVENSSGNDILNIKDDGTFTLGQGATNNAGNNSVIIGKSATDTAATNTYNTIIGASASVTGASNAANVVVGDSSLSTASGGVAIGSEAQSNAVAAIAIGQRAKPTGANSVTLDATGTSVTAPNTAKAFGVYMSNNTTPDFRIVHDGNSYITGTGNFGVDVTTPSDRIQTKTSIGVIGDGTNAGKLKLYCEAGTAHHVAIEGPAHSGGSTYTIKLPNTAPSAGQILQSDSSGNLSWKSLSQLDFSGLPTSDPGVEGRLYNDEGTIKVSIP
tara:strand:+ start:9492 stop:13115 length:3624 start_codon:yes stop_codon:yes gene_type:complete